MDKEYMLIQVRRRISELELVYKAACECKTVDGRTLSLSGAGSKRAHTKKDIQLLMLIEYLLLSSNSVVIDDDDAIDGFDKLIH